MYTSREEKEKLVIDLYYNKGYTYRQIAEQLRMSPNQIRDVIRKDEEKSNAIANEKKELSLSTKAYKLFSERKTNVEVAIALDIPQPQVTQFRSEYWKLQGQDDLVSLDIATNGNATPLWKLHDELVINRGMSIDKVANLVDTALNRLPYVERHHERAKFWADKQQYRANDLERRIRFLEEEERKRKRVIPLPHSYYHYEDRRNSAMNTYSSYTALRQPPPLPYHQAVWSELSSQYGNEQKNSKGIEEIREDEGEFAD